MVELTEEQVTVLDKWIDREFFCIATSLFNTLIRACIDVPASDVDLCEFDEAIANIYTTPRLESHIERFETLEQLNLELEELEDSDTPDEDSIEDLSDQISNLSDLDSWEDNNPPGATNRIWIVSNHMGGCPYFEDIANIYPGAVVPLVELGGVYFWLDFEYNLHSCDWLRLLVREYLCARS